MHVRGAPDHNSAIPLQPASSMRYSDPLAEGGGPARRNSNDDQEFEDGTPLLDTRVVDEEAKASSKRLLVRLSVSFFLFGLLNNILYVIILSAALDLVPPSTPKGVILFCNIAPGLIAKIGWPYILRGRIRYAKRLVGCCALSVLGMMVVAGFDTLGMRLLGICFASFASGLGELTFLQLSTTYPIALAGHSVGYFASGTGGAGVGGAALWWEVRGLGVKRGVAISAVLPFIIPLSYFFLLPAPARFDEGVVEAAGSGVLYSALPSTDSSEYTAPVTPTQYNATPSEEPSDAESTGPKGRIKFALTPSDKLRLVKPLLLKYMLPLFCVYIIEYTINQGVAPTLIYPVPDPATHWILKRIITSLRDYYPLWQLVYQTFVFFSRSSISVGLPPLPQRLLGLPAIIQSMVLITLSIESAKGLFPDNLSITIPLVIFMIAIEGVCGGLAYVNVFYHIGQQNYSSPDDSELDRERKKQEREFRIGSIGFSDSTGIMLASLLAMPTEIELCKAQVRRGRDFCKTL